MLVVFVAAAIQSNPNTLTLTLDIPLSESVWVYSHASDAAHDPYLRVWGAGGVATSGAGPSDDWSYGYLRWKLSQQTVLYGKPSSATLVLHNVSPAALKPESEPIQVRALKGTFSADDWDYSKANDVVPGGDDTVFGEGKPKDLTSTPIEIQVKLDAKFLDYYAAALTKKNLFMTLTSKIDANTESGGSAKGGIYKIFSAASDEKMRPYLHLVFRS